jgi:cytochrome P450
MEELLLDHVFSQDPHGVFERLRRESPVQRALDTDTGVEIWVVSRYADARALLNDPRLSKDNELGRGVYPPGVANPHDTPLSAHMLFSDPPDHTRLRNLVNKAFTMRRVAGLRPRIEKITNDLLDGMSGTVDLLDSFAFPLPINVICELLGVPEDDRGRLRAWSKPMIGYGTLAEIQAAGQEMAMFLAGLIEAKRVTPTDDLLSDLIHVMDDGDRLSQHELLSMCTLLLVAGFETTVNLIGNSVLALLHHPAQLAALRADRSLLPGAIEEFLRFDGPINLSTMRVSTEPIQVAGVEIPAGVCVLLSLQSANRDSDRFEDPDRLDITRDATGHLAFGFGIHHCIGAPLARLEGEIALGGLLDRFPDLTLDIDYDQLVWNSRGILIRGLASFPVRLGSPVLDGRSDRVTATR